jgi:hypothetical protein
MDRFGRQLSQSVQGLSHCDPKLSGPKRKLSEPCATYYARAGRGISCRQEIVGREPLLAEDPDLRFNAPQTSSRISVLLKYRCSFES